MKNEQRHEFFTPGDVVYIAAQHRTEVMLHECGGMFGPLTVVEVSPVSPEGDVHDWDARRMHPQWIVFRNCEGFIPRGADGDRGVPRRFSGAFFTHTNPSC